MYLVSIIPTELKGGFKIKSDRQDRERQDKTEVEGQADRATTRRWLFSSTYPISEETRYN